ncbi:hypothetical protein LINPERPRIM_LOCUS9067 [Linum perenne]
MAPKRRNLQQDPPLSAATSDEDSDLSIQASRRSDLQSRSKKAKSGNSNSRMLVEKMISTGSVSVPDSDMIAFMLEIMDRMKESERNEFEKRLKEVVIESLETFAKKSQLIADQAKSILESWKN